MFPFQLFLPFYAGSPECGGPTSSSSSSSSSFGANCACLYLGLQLGPYAFGGMSPAAPSSVISVTISTSGFSDSHTFLANRPSNRCALVVEQWCNCTSFVLHCTPPR